MLFGESMFIYANIPITTIKPFDDEYNCKLNVSQTLKQDMELDVIGSVCQAKAYPY